MNDCSIHQSNLEAGCSPQPIIKVEACKIGLMLKNIFQKTFLIIFFNVGVMKNVYLEPLDFKYNNCRII